MGLRDLITHSAAEVTGLHGEGAAAIVTVGSRPGRSIEHLRRSIGLSHSGSVRLVDRLEERGLVVRVAADAGREIHLHLTGEGAAVFRRVLDARRALLQEALAPIERDERELLERSLERLLAGLPRSRTDAWQICRLCEHDVCRGDTCPVGVAASAGDAEDAVT